MHQRHHGVYCFRLPYQILLNSFCPLSGILLELPGKSLPGIDWKREPPWIFSVPFLSTIVSLLKVILHYWEKSAKGAKFQGTFQPLVTELFSIGNLPLSLS